MEGMALVRVLQSPEEAMEMEGGRAVGLRGRAGQGAAVPEGVIAGVAVVGVPPGLDALITLRAMPVDRMGTGVREKGELQLGATWGALREKKKSIL